MNLPAKKKKTGGIQKGYVYPKTVAFRQALDDKGFYVPDKLIELYNQIPDEKQFLKLEILKEMNRYCYPVPKDYGEGEKPIDLTEKLKDVSTSDLLKVFEFKDEPES